MNNNQQQSRLEGQIEEQAKCSPRMEEECQDIRIPAHLVAEVQDEEPTSS
ncbi:MULTISPECIES: hypothetical protein [Laceyella]|jgi:hypothetical protein|uniref:Uncharacterized protein n=2 Tax=Laceyella TaxID=292635 RepID=A0AA45WLP2_9BACL|nr:MULTISPECIES: hypothetical protein [Laceyella]MRG28919.1 hypothetical protein [Laceyella tengchongensis]PRZ17031.1 hypothetical protein CLV36_101118 [Laceyella sediminis]SMP11684.1 hypothetical protein SAMN06265361_102274 [Laceyella tengchongensis]